MIYFKSWYDNVVKIDLLYKVNILNSYRLPFVDKVILNACTQHGKYTQSNMLYLITALTLVTSQRPNVYKVFKSITGLKIENNTSLAFKVALYKTLVYRFLDNLILFISYHSRIISTYKFDKINSFSISLNDLSLFPYLIGYLSKLLYTTVTININFALFGLKVLKVLISTFQVRFH